jgi:hypothetical protein
MSNSTAEESYKLGAQTRMQQSNSIEHVKYVKSELKSTKKATTAVASLSIDTDAVKSKKIKQK